MSLKGLLAELQVEYLATFPEKIMRMDSLWRSGKLQELASEFHKIKGTGRTYGIPEVTVVGEALEALVEMNHSQLNQAVPAALYVLEQIRKARSAGRELKLEHEAQFVMISGLLSRPD